MLALSKALAFIAAFCWRALRSHRSRSFLIMLLGVVLSAYGLFTLLELDHIHLSKFSADGKDTSFLVMVILIGLAAFIHGLIQWATAFRSDTDDDA